MKFDFKKNKNIAIIGGIVVVMVILSLFGVI